jgi:hypothetical protein
MTLFRKYIDLASQRAGPLMSAAKCASQRACPLMSAAWKGARMTVQNALTSAARKRKRAATDFFEFRDRIPMDDKFIALCKTIYDAMKDCNLSKELYVTRMLMFAMLPDQKYPVIVTGGLADSALSYHDDVLLSIQDPEERSERLSEFSALIDVKNIQLQRIEEAAKRLREESGQEFEDAGHACKHKKLRVESGEASKDAHMPAADIFLSDQESKAANMPSADILPSGQESKDADMPSADILPSGQESKDADMTGATFVILVEKALIAQRLDDLIAEVAGNQPPDDAAEMYAPPQRSAPVQNVFAP